MAPFLHNLLSTAHNDTSAAAVVRGDMVTGQTGPIWARLAIGAASTHLESDGTDITWQTNLTMADDAWIGLGAVAGRLVFDSTPAPDQLEVTAADLYIATTAHGIIHVDGVTDGQFLRANGTRYVPDTLDVDDLTDLAYAVPAFTLGTANAIGSADTVVRSDATIAVFDATVPNVIECDDAAATGAAAVAARRDHEHGIVCAAPSANLAVDTTNAEGVATSFGRSDHSHAITSSSNPGAAASILATDASGYLQLVGLGIGAAPGSADLHFATGTGITHADGVAAGQFLRANGTRYVPDTLDVDDITDLAYAVPAFTLSTANAVGSADTVVRSDATIAVFDATVPNVIECDDAAATGVAAVAARRDHEHGIVCAAPSANLAVDTTNAEGVATSFGRSDHSHAITTSSNPGAAASILATDASGYLQLVGLGIGTAATAADSITFADDGWEGLGPAAGRLSWDSTAAPDTATFYSCNVGIGSAPGAGEHFIVEDTTVNTTVTYYGIRNSHTKTAGASDQDDHFYGLSMSTSMNQAGEIGHFAGIVNITDLDNGNIGDAVYSRNIYGIDNRATMASGADHVYGDFYGMRCTATVSDGEVHDDVFGANVVASIGASGQVDDDVFGLWAQALTDSGATITGDIYGAYIAVDDDAGVGGTAYMLYLAEYSNIDYGVYQDGSADNYFGGHVGVGVDPGAGQHLAIEDTTLTTTVTYYGVYNYHIKTAGVTDSADSFFGVYNWMELDHTGGTIGDTYGIYSNTRLDNGTVDGDYHGIYNVLDCNAGDITGTIYGTVTALDLEAAMTGIGGGVYGLFTWIDADETPTNPAYLCYIRGYSNVSYGFYQYSAEDNIFGGDLKPLNNKGSDLGDAALRWNAIFYASATTGTSRLVQSTRICPVCDEQMIRGTGTLTVLGDDADYTLAHCPSCGVVAMEELKHLPVETLAFRESPPKIEFTGFDIKPMSGNSRLVFVNFRYEDDVTEELEMPDGKFRSVIVKRGRVNSTMLGETEYEAFLNMTESERGAFLRMLGEREWYAMEELRLMQEECSQIQTMFEIAVNGFVGQDLLQVA